MATGDPSYLQVANNAPAAPVGGQEGAGQEGEAPALLNTSAAKPSGDLILTPLRSATPLIGTLETRASFP